MRLHLSVAFLLLTTCALGQGVAERIRIDLTPVSGFGPFYPPLGGAGPAGDPINGPIDLTGDVVSGIPDTLIDLDLRFLNFQWAQGAYQALVADGKASSVQPFGTTSAYVDQQVHYVVGRDSARAFVWIVDTDNDEDLSDETAQVLPWDGPRMTIETFRDSILSGPDPVAYIESMPSVEVTGQVFDGEHIADVTRKAYLIPFLEITYPHPDGPQAEAFYWLAFDGHYTGDLEAAGGNYRIWLRSASNNGLVEPRWTHIRLKQVTSGDTTFSGHELELTPAPYALGDVVEIGGSYFRLDDVDPLGRHISLIKVVDPAIGLAVGTKAPDFRARALDGQDVALGALNGRHVLLIFWSSRNTSFRGALDAFYPNYKGDCVEFVSILDDNVDTARSLDWLGIPWSVVADKAQKVSIQALYGVANHPSFVLIDPNGQVVGWEAIGTYPIRKNRSSFAVLDKLRGELDESCLEGPTPDDVQEVLDANPQWTTDADWYVPKCSFTAEDVEVVSIAPAPDERGWPVQLVMSGTCSPPANSDRSADWHEEFRLNTVLYRDRGEWGLIASEPFVEE